MWCKKHHTAHWRKDPANLERSRAAARRHTAKKRLVALAEQVKGFHPDKPGADYRRLPDGLEAEQVDQVVAQARDLGVDVYAATGIKPRKVTTS